MDSTRREAALARRRERERARANETAEERETRLARRRVRDRRANETSPSPNCSKYNSNVQKLCSCMYRKLCSPPMFSAHAAHARPKDVCIALVGRAGASPPSRTSATEMFIYNIYDRPTALCACARFTYSTMVQRS